MQEGRIGRAAQQLVQFLELAALAFPPHPPFLPVAPDSATMQQQEAVACGAGAVKTVQPRDACRGNVEQRRVPRGVLAGGVCPVRKQREVELAFGRGQVVNLEAFELRFQRRARREQCGHDYHRPQT